MEDKYKILLNVLHSFSFKKEYCLFRLGLNFRLFDLEFNTEKLINRFL